MVFGRRSESHVHALSVLESMPLDRSQPAVVDTFAAAFFDLLARQKETHDFVVAALHPSRQLLRNAGIVDDLQRTLGLDPRLSEKIGPPWSRLRAHAYAFQAVSRALGITELWETRGADWQTQLRAIGYANAEPEDEIENQVDKLRASLTAMMLFGSEDIREFDPVHMVTDLLDDPNLQKLCATASTERTTVDPDCEIAWAIGELGEEFAGLARLLEFRAMAQLPDRTRDAVQAVLDDERAAGRGPIVEKTDRDITD